jgi:GTP pyrophosphokinase
VNEDEKERLIAVAWGEMEQTYPVTIKIEVWDRVGLLRDISAIIADAGVNIVEAGVEERKDNASSLYFTLEVRDTLQLTKVISRIYSVWNVVNITRKGDKE